MIWDLATDTLVNVLEKKSFCLVFLNKVGKNKKCHQKATSFDITRSIPDFTQSASAQFMKKSKIHEKLHIFNTQNHYLMQKRFTELIVATDTISL